MKANSITIRHSVFIKTPPQTVWDFTQNYQNRPAWDDSVLETAVLQSKPHRMVRMKMKGGTEMTFVYKLDNPPNKTTLAAKDIQSPVFDAAGGSWVYSEMDGGTLWTQTNTIVLKPNFLWWLMRPLLKWMLQVQTRMAMQKAKKILENTRWE